VLRSQNVLDNGYPYTASTGADRAQSHPARGNVVQRIREDEPQPDWRHRECRHTNRSFIFFASPACRTKASRWARRESQLTPLRSIAVDRPQCTDPLFITANCR